MVRLQPYFPKSHGKPRVDDGSVLSGMVIPPKSRGDYHGADFGATSSAQYQQMTDNFLTGPRGTNTLERIRPNGDVVRYDPTTDAFGVVSSNGTVRTYYVPDPAVHGYATNLDYFNAQ